VDIPGLFSNNITNLLFDFAQNTIGRIVPSLFELASPPITFKSVKTELDTRKVVHVEGIKFYLS